MRKLEVIIASVLFAACQNDYTGPARSGRDELVDVAPVIRHASVQANPANVLSATIFASVGFADSVAVRFRLADASGAEETTPTMDWCRELECGVGFVNFTLLGLLPASRYVLHVVAWGWGDTRTSEQLEFTTGALPADLPHFTAGGPDPTPGYVVFGAGEYGLVIDNTGRIVWYHHLPGGAGLAFMAQSNGHYVTQPRTTDPTNIQPWIEVDPDGNIARSLSCGQNLRPRLHDLIVAPDGGYWILCDESRPMDLTSDGGVSNARVTGTAIQNVNFCDYVGYYYYYGCTTTLDFSWSPFDHFQITDVDASERAGPDVNWTHGNSIDLDTDGNLIVSFRNLNEITKIDRQTGEVIWRLGGVRNEFTFLDTPVPAFIHQHSVRFLAGGELLLLDNLGDPTQSRVERYKLDEAGRTARLIGSFNAGPGVVTSLGGSVQPLPGGRTLASFGTAGRVLEYDAAGNIVWSIDGNAGYIFRAQRINSLYTPGVGTMR